MSFNKKILLMVLLSPLLQNAHAANCEPNGLGGSLCVNDNGTTSDSIKNNGDGLDTLSSNGKWTSSVQDGAGVESTLNNNGITAKPSSGVSLNAPPRPKTDDTLNGTYEPKPDDLDKALLGSDWNSPSNIISDSPATSSSHLDDSSSDKWP